MNRRHATLCIALATCSLAAREAEAQTATAPVVLEWSAPARCAVKDRVLADIAKMARPPANQPPVTATVSVIERGSIDTRGREEVLLVADIAIRGGARRIEGTSCEALADAVALVIALAIDPAAKPLDSTPASTPAPAPAPAPTSSGRSEAPAARSPDMSTGPEGTLVNPTPEVPPVSFHDRHLQLGAEVAIDLATMPSVAIAPRAFIGGRVARVSLEAFGSLFTEQTTTSDVGGTAVGADISGFEAGGRAAYAFAIDRVELGPTLGIALHHLEATAFGASRSGSGTADWATVRPGGRAVLEIAPAFGIRAEIEAEIALARPEFVIANVAGRVHQPGQLSGCAALGVELRFF